MKHRHIPAIIHRTGGEDADYHNRCAECGEKIERATIGEPWATEAEADEYAAEMATEAQHEAESADWESLHPESRCPSRE